MQFDIYLDWPSKYLHANNSKHWYYASKPKKKQRNEAYALTKAQTTQKFSGRVKLDVTFHEPDGRRRDKHNLPISVKGAIDGIADALGVDDYFFDVSFHHGEIKKGGEVHIKISPAESRAEITTGGD